MGVVKVCVWRYACQGVRVKMPVWKYAGEGVRLKVYVWCAGECVRVKVSVWKCVCKVVKVRGWSYSCYVVRVKLCVWVCLWMCMWRYACEGVRVKVCVWRCACEGVFRHITIKMYNIVNMVIHIIYVAVINNIFESWCNIYNKVDAKILFKLYMTILIAYLWWIKCISDNPQQQ